MAPEIEAADRGTSAGGFNHSGQHLERGGFAGFVRTRKPDNLARERAGVRGFHRTRTVHADDLALRQKRLLTLALSSFVPQEEREIVHPSLSALLVDAISATVNGFYKPTFLSASSRDFQSPVSKPDGTGKSR